MADYLAEERKEVVENAKRRNKYDSMSAVEIEEQALQLFEVRRKARDVVRSQPDSPRSVMDAAHAANSASSSSSSFSSSSTGTTIHNHSNTTFHIHNNKSCKS